MARTKFEHSTIWFPNVFKVNASWGSSWTFERLSVISWFVLQLTFSPHVLLVSVFVLVVFFRSQSLLKISSAISDSSFSSSVAVFFSKSQSSIKVPIAVRIVRTERRCHIQSDKLYNFNQIYFLSKINNVYPLLCRRSYEGN